MGRHTPIDRFYWMTSCLIVMTTADTLYSATLSYQKELMVQEKRWPCKKTETHNQVQTPFAVYTSEGVVLQAKHISVQSYT